MIALQDSTTSPVGGHLHRAHHPSVVPLRNAARPSRRQLPSLLNLSRRTNPPPVIRQEAATPDAHVKPTRPHVQPFRTCDGTLGHIHSSRHLAADICNLTSVRRRRERERGRICNSQLNHYLLALYAALSMHIPSLSIEGSHATACVSAGVAHPIANPKRATCPAHTHCLHRRRISFPC